MKLHPVKNIKHEIIVITPANIEALFIIFLKFIDIFRFMLISLSNLVSNLSEGFHNDQCEDCKSCLEYNSIEDNQLIFKMQKIPKCNKSHLKHFNKDLIKRFANTFELCDEEINKFILLLRKIIYPYEYMESWKRFNETSLSDGEGFYSHLNIENYKC